MKGAEEAIGTFQEHRTIHRLIGELEDEAALTPGATGPRLARLRDMLSAHVSAEEDCIFPWALETVQRIREVEVIDRRHGPGRNG